MIHPARLQPQNDLAPRRGRYVLYWMQQAQRAEFNDALEYAIEQANTLALPVLAAFALAPFPDANARPYRFMLEGLRETRNRLAARGIGFCVRKGAPEEVLPPLAKHAALLVGDVGYLPVQRNWRRAVGERIRCPFALVETDAIVPVAEASDHAEFAARTLRPKIHKKLPQFLKRPRMRKVATPSLNLVRDSLSLDDPGALCRAIGADDSVPAADHPPGGAAAAGRLLQRFLSQHLADYAASASDPVLDATSRLSPYLHFGQLSSLDIALRVANTDAPRNSADAFLEQLIVRRELAINACWHQPASDRYDALPEWARKTLALHRRDKRDFLYARGQWEAAATHDPCWNAAQTELLRSGRMHNYMRMYWGKKIIEWSASPEEAFDTALYLNNKYQLDGRDPNGIVGVAWCFGLHDRPWTERPVFGTIRYMNANGLRRKFDIQAYLDRWLGPRDPPAGKETP